MAKLVSEAQKIIDRMKAEGKVREVDIDFDKIDEEMEKVRRDYRRKAAASWRSVWNVILTD